MQQTMVCGVRVLDCFKEVFLCLEMNICVAAKHANGMEENVFNVMALSSIMQ